MKKSVVLFLLVAMTLGMTQCTPSSHTVEVAKPRTHQSWPPNHRWKKKIKVWKIRLWPLERSGPKTVKMKS